MTKLGSGIYRSEDGGKTWKYLSRMNSRPFYYSHILLNPVDDQRVYYLTAGFMKSEDGGKTWQNVPGLHPDYHAMWLDPMHKDRYYNGQDAGAALTHDHGRTFIYFDNICAGQFSAVSADMRDPYHVYGGLQDNGSLRGPSTVWENGGIRNLHWQELCFGDGFATMPCPGDCNLGYAMSQGGALVRWDLRTGTQRAIRPPAPADGRLRFHWNAALAQDPFDAGTIWFGSQFVHRSTDRGDSWQVMSPDLTTDNPAWQQQGTSGGLTRDVTGAENHCTILCIAPSPVQRSVIWVGTDDGLVQLTRDGGQSWRRVEHLIPGLPENTWCPHIEADKFDAATAYAVFDGHRNADWTPYVFVTRDFGASWTSLGSAVLDGYCLVLEQDPRQRDMLWLGTEFGLFVSFDGGASWQRWRHGVPACSAMAITTEPRTGDLVVATHGRSIYVLDDLTPLRGLSPALLAAKLHLFAVQPAIAFRTAQTPGSRFPGSGEFRGAMRPRGAFVDVIADVGEPAEDAAAKGEQGKNGPRPNEVEIEIRDADGTVVRTFRREVHRGLNRIVWGLERDGLPRPGRALQDEPELPPPGREVLPGDYELTVRFRGEQRTTKVAVRPDPRVAIAMADRVAKDELLARVERIQAELRPTTQQLWRSKRDLDFLARRLELEQAPAAGAEDPLAALRAALQAARAAFDEIDERIWGPREVQGIADRSAALWSRLAARLHVDDGGEAPTATEIEQVERALACRQDIVDAIAAFETGPMARCRTELQASGLCVLPAAK
jgi:photosystem II stability/assembly factor-like uncharacterized protein